MTDPTPADQTPPPTASAPPVSAPAGAASAPPPASTTWTPPAATTIADRPTGITILSILAGLGAIGSLLAGFTVFTLGTLVFGLSAAIFGLAWLALAGLGLAFGIGAWQMKPWAWPLGIVLAAGAIIWGLLLLIGGGNNILSFLITAVLYGAILYYLNQPGIKSLFGRA
jgi:hypothetical protein